VDVVVQLSLCLLVAVSRQEFDDQRVLDSEDRVIVKILACLVEDLSRDGLVSFSQHDEMNVGRSVRMSVQQLQKFTRWSVVWNRVRCWSQAVKAVLSVLICVELAAQIGLGLFLILLLVQAICRCFPDVNRGLDHWLLCGRIYDLTIKICHFGVFRQVVYNTFVLVPNLVVRLEKRTENGTLGCQVGGLGGFLVCDFIHECF